MLAGVGMSECVLAYVHAAWVMSSIFLPFSMTAQPSTMYSISCSVVPYRFCIGKRILSNFRILILSFALSFGSEVSSNAVEFVIDF